uniref:UBX domain-containing protein n=1 Tax=Caenorhabditis japonica TaxID=281687 RepID=A0A8R1DQ29_CAEJA
MSRNIRTFRDLGANDDGPDSDDSGADVGRGAPQTFYAGSGQAVQGPRGARNPEDAARANAEAHIRRILQAAEQVNPEEASQGPNGGEIVNLVLHLWTDGLSIEDGPLMSREDPATIQFLDTVGRGAIPAEIARQYPGKQIDFSIDRRNEAYVAPKMKPFGGTGVRLGNVVPNIVGESSTSSAPVETAAPAQNLSAEEAARNLEQAKKELNTDSAQPTTNIQIRLPSNQRLVATFNQTHTLESVRTFICTARPDMIYAPFQLMSAYPSKVLEDESISLKDGNLLNSVIAVKVTPAV